MSHALHDLLAATRRVAPLLVPVLFSMIPLMGPVCGLRKGQDRLTLLASVFIVIALTAPLLQVFSRSVLLFPGIALVWIVVQTFRCGAHQVRPTTWFVRASLIAPILLASWFYHDEYVRQPPPGISLASPLNGDVVVGAGGLTKRFNHHLGYGAQDLAVDLLRPYEWGDILHALKSDTRGNSSFGAPVFAPCDGEVLASVNALPDQKIGEVDEVYTPGNFLIIRCAAAAPAGAPEVRLLLGHLRHGSLCVRNGEKVSEGQLVAAIGNSGNTTTPHLHMQAYRPSGDSLFGGDPVAMYVDGYFLRTFDRIEN